MISYNIPLQNSLRAESLLNCSLMVQLLVTQAVIVAASSLLVQIHAWSVAEQIDLAIPATVQSSYDSQQYERKYCPIHSRHILGIELPQIPGLHLRQLIRDN